MYVCMWEYVRMHVEDFLSIYSEYAFNPNILINLKSLLHTFEIVDTNDRSLATH